MGRVSISIVLFSLAFVLYAQTTLWKDTNPYSRTHAVGDILRVDIDERFTIKLDNKWETKTESEVELVPDRTYLDFLKPSEQKRTFEKNSKNETRLQDRITYSIAASVTEVNGSVLTLSGTRRLVIDGRNLQLNFSGRVSSSSIRAGRVPSADVSDLVLNVQAEPEFPRQGGVALKTKEQADAESPQKAVLSDAEKQQILLQYLQQVLGGNNP